MVGIAELLLPILLSAVLVFIASSVIHMMLGYHSGDHRTVPSEDRVREALREAQIPPGDYAIPNAGSMKEMGSAEFIEKQNEGPVAVLTVMPDGPPSMVRILLLWFVFLLAVSTVVAYVVGRALPPGTEYLQVFRIAGTVAFLAYAADTWSRSIWFGQKWSTALKNTLDGLVYALLTGGAFGAFWP